MKPVLLPLAEHIGRVELRRRGIISGHVQTPHGRLHVYDARGRGSLPTTVVLHGLGSGATPFGPVLGRLRRHVRRVVAPDLPGHGFSATVHDRLTPMVLFESIKAALDETLSEPAVLVGNSLGGGVALRYALAQPSRVQALVLVSPAGARCSDEELRALKSVFRIRTRDDARSFVHRLYHRPPLFVPLVLHELSHLMTRKAVVDILETASNDDAPTAAELGSLPMPILFVWGRSEKLLPETHYEYFAQHLPRHAVIERPEGFGHCPHFDDPDAFVQRIVRFIEGVVAAPNRPP